jgi:hypothetical protein
MSKPSYFEELKGQRTMLNPIIIKYQFNNDKDNNGVISIVMDENSKLIRAPIKENIHFLIGEALGSDKFVKLRFQYKDEEDKNVDVPSSIQKTLHSGIMINNVQYHFIGFSNSQLSDRSCYLYEASDVQKV